MKQLVLKVHHLDNVLVALQPLQKGQSIYVEKKSFVLKDDIAAKHKFYIDDMEMGSEVIMYGV